MDEQQQQPRTAAATAAAMRRAEERRAEFLRGRGWECTPPDGVVRLTAIARPAVGSPGPQPELRVSVVGPRAAGGKPRANTDGAGERELAAFFVAAQLPAQPEHMRQLDGLTEVLSAAGYVPDGAWTVGVDPHGRYASVGVTRSYGRQESEHPPVLPLDGRPGG